MAKRALDIVISALGLIFLAPFFLLVAILIKMDSEGPVLYLQERVGKGGKLFQLFKFRSMSVNADRGAAITVGNRDARITSTGYFLRKFKLDELPQLINVIIGQMSLVGPRPEVARFVDLYTEEQREVLTVKPGITDYASIEFRNENAMLEGKADPINFYISEIMPLKLALNLKYMTERNFWLDVRIIVKTIFLIFQSSKS